MFKIVNSLIQSRLRISFDLQFVVGVPFGRNLNRFMFRGGVWDAPVGYFEDLGLGGDRSSGR